MAISRPKMRCRAALPGTLAFAASVLLGASDFGAFTASAQPGRRGGPAGAAIQLSPEDMARMQAAQGAVQPQGQPGQQPGGEKPKEGEEKKPDGEKKEEAKTVKRPTEKPKADAAELKVAPDKDGMVQFNFRGQPWTDVLEWFAGVAGYSLDWQELPADFLNLSTQRRHTLAETRDLLNRHLLARGFTMILQGESLTVVKTDKIDPSLVPRVDADDLDDQSPHDFVRTRFPIPDTMDPAKAVEDVKLLLSPAAKVTPLLASKQLQVIDAVANLRDVRDLLYDEQLVASKDVRPKPFTIRHRRADYIADQVMIVLGLDPSSRKTPMELQIEQQRMQLYMQMQQKGTDITKMLKQDGPQVFIAVDKRRNALLVNAPPKEMAMIERTINEFDVPEGGVAAAGGDENRQLAMRQHSTITVSPDAVITALKEMGDLDPLTQLQSDSNSKTIFAYATPADHATIEGMIGRLDGTGRGLKVVWLSRRTPADQVAGTIKALMVGEKKKENNNRRDYWYYGYDRGGGGEQEPEAAFRIQADVENNRLLLWANDDEYAEVTTLLKELGAIASDSGSNPNKWRVLDARTPDETAKMLEKLQQSWGGKNRLNINVAPAKAEDVNDAAPAKPADDEPDDKDKITNQPVAAPASGRGLVWITENFPAGDATPGQSPGLQFVERRTIHRSARNEGSFRLVAQQELPADAQAAPEDSAPNVVADETSPATAATNPAPINITVTPDGRIVISSDDVAALDQLEDLMAELEPARRDFEVFPLKNSRASMVALNLEEYFADELSDDGNQSFNGWWGWGGDEKKEDPATLGKSRKLRFIWDSDTNTIVAQNASPSQLEVIRKLIEIYDQPVSEDSVSKRRTDIVAIRYSSAQDIATAIKEVYRDLLSSKDKEFQSRGGEGEKSDRGRESRFSFWGGSGSSSQKSAPMKMSFEGPLSIGVDEISNSLIISADEQIWENVKDLAVSLDEKAKPDTVVQVHQLSGSLDPKRLQNALQDVLGQPWPGGKPAQAQNGRGDGDRGNNDRGGDQRRNRGGDGDRKNRDGDRNRD